MKNLLLAGLIGATFTMSCNSVSTAKTAQSNRTEFLKMKGDWEIVSINYDSKFKIKPFDEGADAQCFVGSHWRLIPNNYTGAYTLKGGDNCPSKIQPIKFEVLDGNTFQFKKIVEGEKAKQNVKGYVMTLTNQATDQFSLQQSIPFEGEMINVIYNFERTAVR